MSGHKRGAGLAVWVGVLTVGFVLPAAAQQRGRGFGGFFGRGGGIGLLTVEAVQDELKLSAEQKEKIEALADVERANRRERFQELSDLSPDEQVKRTARHADELDKKVAIILDESQQQRFSQLEVQVAGPNVLTRARFAKIVGLEAEQTKKIGAIQLERREAIFEIFRAARDGGDREAMREQMQTVQEKHNEKIVAVLTDDQRKAFAKMKGEPFEFPQRGRGRG